MNGNNITVRLNPGQIELLLTKKLCGKDGAVLSDRREIETSGGKSILLVFSRFLTSSARSVLLISGRGYFHSLHKNSTNSLTFSSRPSKIRPIS